MKLFDANEVREALAYAAEGGQALHVHRIIVNRFKAPRCFVAAVDGGHDIGHLFDQDYKRLIDTAQRLGVRVIAVHRAGTNAQHIDLCVGPLLKAKAWCETINAIERNLSDDR